MSVKVNMTWNCHYCNKKFDSLLDRDNHHRTHVEHYRKMFDYLLFIVEDLKKENMELKVQLDRKEKEYLKYAKKQKRKLK